SMRSAPIVVLYCLCASLSRDLPPFPTRRSSDLHVFVIPSLISADPCRSPGCGGTFLQFSSAFHGFQHRYFVCIFKVSADRNANPNRKATRLNSSTGSAAYAAFWSKKNTAHLFLR